MQDKTKLIALFTLFLILPIVQAEVYITKNVSEYTVYEADAIKINIEVANNNNNDIEGTLYDMPPKFAAIVGYQPSEDDKEVIYSQTEVIKSFDVHVPANDKKIYTYSISFDPVPSPLLNKEYNLGVSKFVDTNNKEYFSNSVNILFKTERKIVCNYDFKCDPGENHANCMQDCLSGSEDNFCDKLKDGRCDPDCTPEEDTDCLEEREKRKPLNLWIIIIPTGILILAFIIFIIIKRKSNIGKLE